eukprot:449058-Pelagomonas_calceolata.AAC.1
MLEDVPEGLEQSSASPEKCCPSGKGAASRIECQCWMVRVLRPELGVNAGYKGAGPWVGLMLENVPEGLERSGVAHVRAGSAMETVNFSMEYGVGYG